MGDVFLFLAFSIFTCFILDTKKEIGELFEHPSRRLLIFFFKAALLSQFFAKVLFYCLATLFSFILFMYIRTYTQMYCVNDIVYRLVSIVDIHFATKCRLVYSRFIPICTEYN